MTSLGIEIIMGGSAEHDAAAYDNSARIAAWLLWKHRLTIDRLVTHTYWVNKSVGNICSDVDVQSTTPVAGKKWCPTYIFKSTNHKVALANWKSYKALVKIYLDALNKPEVKTDNIPDGWAKGAIDFAIANKILIGDEYGDYKLRQVCTRQEMLVFLYRLYSLVE